ncbi:uncharacterized protein LOC124554059 [Schistocerca americana]|uniref:uncharacterized protein LOC124554059 n=1 Tax=Schistocerca americana TaxID=7009 RepID=UPI001F502AB3|nr:uncharacterized protein LOC124554059 [Schistocerca americana]
MQVLGSRTADDAVGIGADEVPPDASPVGLPAVPYPVADSVGLQELQNAMGATDEEMAILQQLGGEGPIWVPGKGEASDLLSAPKVEEEEEEEEEEADIVDLDCQRSTPDMSSVIVSCGGGEGAAEAAVRTSGAPAEVGESVPDASGRHAVSAPRAAAPAAKVSAKRKRQRRTRPAKAAGSGGENLLAAYEEKEMVCPSCHRFFLGVSALQQHVRVAHDGRVDPVKRRKNHCSTVSGPSECVAASALGTPADSPPRLVCPHCRELLVGRDALVAHVAEDHPGSAVPTDFATLTAPPNSSSESVGLKTHISTALGGLLDRALNNRPEKGPGSGDSASHHRRSRQTPVVPPKLTAPRSEPETEAGSSSSSGRPRRVYDTELARRVWQQLSSRQPPTELELQRATASADGSSSRVFATGTWCRRTRTRSSPPRRHSWSPTPTRMTYLPVKTPTTVGTDRLTSPKREIEAVFVEEAAPFLHKCELPDSLDTTRDPLSIEEEGGALGNDPLPICDLQRIKKEVLEEDPVAVSGFGVLIKQDPDLYLGVDATENKVYSNF